ncbi:MAG: response regulator [Nitrososphaeraceae archaeon]
MSAPTTGTNSDASTAHHSDDPRKILIVDDDSDLTSMFKMVLEMNGFEVDGFEVDVYNDALLALYDLKPNSYGMALLDIRMPKMNGFELYKKMQDIDNNMKVCFITAFEDYNDEFRQSFPQLDEANCFVRKPKAIEDLVKHVTTILG